MPGTRRRPRFGADILTSTGGKKFASCPPPSTGPRAAAPAGSPASGLGRLRVRTPASLVPAARKEADRARNLVLAPADLIVGAAPIDERAGRCAQQHAPNAADDVGVRVPLDAFVHLAIEDGDQIGEARRRWARRASSRPIGPGTSATSVTRPAPEARSAAPPLPALRRPPLCCRARMRDARCSRSRTGAGSVARNGFRRATQFLPGRAPCRRPLSESRQARRI